MQNIYLIPKKINPFFHTIEKIYLNDIYEVYPSIYKKDLENICLRSYKNNTSAYDVIHLGEIINKVKEKQPKFDITFLKPDDIIIYFNNGKKDTTKYLRVIITSIIILMGSIMGIMNFHADVNMITSQTNIVRALTNNPIKYLPYFQVSYTIGIGLGVALFFNKFIPNYSKNEPSPLELRMNSLNTEIEKELRKKT